MTYYQNGCHGHHRRALGNLGEKSNTWRENETLIYANHHDPYILKVNCGIPNPRECSNGYLECIGSFGVPLQGGVKHCTSARANMSDVRHNGDISPGWVVHILSPVNNLYVYTILFQLPFGSNKILLQFHTFNRRGWMSCR